MNKILGDKQLKEASIKLPSPTILFSQRTSPSVFSNLVRRKSNNTTPHKQRDSLSTSPKPVISPPVVNIPSPHQEVVEPVEQSKNDTEDNITATPMEVDTQFDESEYTNKRILMRQLLTPEPIE